jgi:hypothetical protein
MSSTLVAPLLIAQPFGFGAANPTFINIPIPVPSQISTTVNAASFTDGFPPNTMTPEASGGLPFFGQDMNGILYMVSAYCANFAAGALSSYNSTLSSAISGYPTGAVLVAEQPNLNTFSLWAQTAASGNTTDPDTGGAGWFPFGGIGATVQSLSNANVTLSALQAALPYVEFTGTLTGNVNVIFPANTGQGWIVSNSCTGAFSITCKTASGTGVAIPQTGPSAPTSVYCDGTNIQNTGVSTAGLAPINSPALTGTPTAPTASPATTNTTQIATTAFTQAAITAALTPYALLASPIFSGVPTVPTAPPGTNTLQAASTAFVQAAIASAVTLIRRGTVSLSNGPNSVNFSSAFPTTCDQVLMTPLGAGATYFVTSKSVNGFTADVGVTQPYMYVAYGS